MIIKIFKGLYRAFCCVREFTVSLFFILFVLAFFAFTSLLSSDSSKSKNADPAFQSGALTLNFDGYLADNHDEFADFRRFLQSEIGNGSEPLKISTFDVVQAIRKAAKDSRIKGIVLDLKNFSGGDIASLTYVGNVLQEFKQSGKSVIAVGDLFSQKQYYLASFADNIYLNKSGMVELQGLSYSNLYFKSLLEKIEAVPYVFRVGTYKSAVEPFLRDNMSSEAKANAQLWLSKLWQNMRDNIAKNREINAENVVLAPEKLLQQYRALKGDDAEFALKQGWITQSLSSREIKQKLIETFGKHPKRGYQHIEYLDYAAELPDRFNLKSQEKIAVVNVEGEIVWGKGDENSAGSDEIVQLLHQARADESVQGVILRVNSPGGSAVASELIRQATEDLQHAGKPVVISMGGMAASGGYWISATADKIIAAPTTLTGSIGIFGLSVNLEKTAKKVGVSEDGIATSPLARQSALKPLDKTHAEMIQISIENGYDRFLALVAKGRKMSKAEVDKVAQGQVWLGETALTHGLVDQLGDFDDAYDVLKSLINAKRKAQNLAERDSFTVQWFIEQKEDFFSQLMRDFKMKAKLDLSMLLDSPLAGKIKQQSNLLNKFNDPKQSYLYCLNCGSVN
ncbi:protease-4 [Bibersteinia trehalosi]|nr:protease-4 [Bibersteinia trehalosi]